MELFLNPGFWELLSQSSKIKAPRVTQQITAQSPFPAALENYLQL